MMPGKMNIKEREIVVRTKIRCGDKYCGPCPYKDGRLNPQCMALPVTEDGKGPPPKLEVEGDLSQRAKRHLDCILGERNAKGKRR
jgi:hypothetical protein